MNASSATPEKYWEARARRFAAQGEGLAAVCSYGMPAYYNRYIQLTQRLALGRWLAVPAGTRALDVGCGVGRWSRWLARQGAQVDGIDLSTTMIAESARRARAEGLESLCRFTVQDLSELAVDRKYDLIVGVTVLQHILDEQRFAEAVMCLRRHLAPGGRIVLLEAAPHVRQSHCDSPIFTARSAAAYLAVFSAAGLSLVGLSGVDPAPFKTAFLPTYGRLPRPLGWLLMLGVVALSLPFDALLGRALASRSWHKVFVLQHDQP